MDKPPTPVDAAKPRSRVEILDVLRAVAVLAVVLFHYGFRGALADQNFTGLTLPALAPYAKYGFLGVQLFFVISGFVIAYSAEQRTALEFGVARIARIYPGFLVCMTLTFVVTIALGAPRFQASLSQWLANSVIVSPALRRPFMDGAYWSLVYEVTFYGWITLFLMLGWFRRRIDTIIVCWMVLAMLNHEIRSSVLQRVFLTDESGFFAAGLIIYEIYAGRRDATVNLLLALSTIVAVGQSLDLVAWSRLHYHVAYDDRIAAGVSVLLIAAVALALKVQRLPLPASLVLGIGGVTYPLYLLHQNIGYMVFNSIGMAAPPLIVASATAAGIIVLAWTIWRYVERPGQRLLKRLLTHGLSRLGDTVSAKRAKV